jgi:inhibitor of KinA
MAEVSAFPRLRCVGDSAILVEFGDAIDPAINGRVVALDRRLTEEPLPGVISLTPAYASLLVAFDPLVTEPRQLLPVLEHMASQASPLSAASRQFEIPVCYDPPYAPDLATVAQATGLSPEAVIAAHLKSTLRVYMYGFAPGYAYLGGLAPEIRLPRRTTPVRDVPAGSVIIAGQQCIVTTFMMATGWWIIGRSPARLFLPEREEPVLLGVGDEVRFVRVGSGGIAMSDG